MTARIPLIALLGALLTTSQATAGELLLSLDNWLSYESNIFKRVSDEVRDGIYSVVPTARVRQNDSEFTYDVAYTPTYDVYFNTNQLNGWDHNFRAESAYQPNGRNQFTVDGRVLNFRTNRSAFGDPGDSPGFAGFNIGRVKRYEAGLGWSHSITQRLVGRLDGDFQQIEYTQLDRTDSIGGGGLAELSYRLTPSDVVGLSAAGSYRRYDASSIFPASRAATANVSLVWNHEFDEHTTISIQGGPTVVVGKQEPTAALTVPRFGLSISQSGQLQAALYENCGQISGQEALNLCPNAVVVDANDPLYTSTVTVGYLPGDEPGTARESDLTYFAAISIQREFDRAIATASYVRRQDATPGVGVTAVLDEIRLRYTHFITRRLTGSLRASWNRREAANEFVAATSGAQDSGIPGTGSPFNLAEAAFLIPTIGVSDTILSQIWADADLRWAWTRNLSLGAKFRYIYQNTRRQSSSSSFQDLHDYIGQISIRWEFDRFIF